MTKQLLISLSNPTAPEHDAEFNRWFNQVHGADVTRLTGIRNLTRYRAIAQAVPPAEQPLYRYVAIYELDDATTAINSLLAAAPNFDMTDTLDLAGAFGIAFEEIFTTRQTGPADQLEANKAVARRFIETLGELNAEGFLDCLADDVEFETPGQFAFAGTKTKADLAREFPAMREILPHGLVFTIETMTAEGDRVHVELAGKAKTADGGDYNNRYHYAFVIRGDKVVRFRDYLDSDLAIRVLGPAFERHGAANNVALKQETAPA